MIQARRLIFAFAVLPISVVPLIASGQDWDATYESRVYSAIKLTQFSPDKTSITLSGTPLVLQTGDLGLWSTVKKRLSFPDNTCAGGAIKPEFPSIVKRESQQGNAHVFSQGDKLWLVKMVYLPKGRFVAFQLVSEPIDGVRFEGTLKFPFSNNPQPTPEQFLATVAQVIQPEGAQIASPNSVAANSPTVSGAGTASAGSGQQSQAGGVGEASTLTVAGVRLGMTPDEAIEALKAYDSWGVVKKRYSEGPHARAVQNMVGGIRYDGSSEGVFGLLGVSEDCKRMNGLPAPMPPLLVAIIAAKANRIHPIPFPSNPSVRYTTPVLSALSDCEWLGTPSASKPGEDPEEVYVYLSPTPGNERVIAVSLWRSFINRPTVETVLAGARKRYSMDVTSVKSDDSGTTTLSWRFDSRNHIMSEGAIERTGISRTGDSGGPSLPNSISAGRGVGLDFYVHASPGQSGIATAYSISLFSEMELFKFTQQAADAQMAIDAQAKQKQIDKAKQNTVEIK